MKDEEIESCTYVDYQTKPLIYFSVGHLTNVPAYQAIPSLEFLNQELEPHAAADFSRIWDKIYSYSGDLSDTLGYEIR